MRNKIIIKFVFIHCILLLLSHLSSTNANDEDYEDLYEPADDICEKCNCSKEISEDGERKSGTVFTIDCSFKDFQHIFAKWTELMGDNHNVVELIYVMSFNDLNRLQQFPSTDAILFFTCRHCKISKLANAAFIDVPNIHSLDLSFNKITSDDLNPDIFRGPQSDNEYSTIKLANLDLSHNAISYLDKNLFEHLPHLKKLDLSYNEMDAFGEGTGTAISKLVELETLDISYTGISELDKTIFENMKHLSELFVTGNKFTSIPDGLSAIGHSLKLLQMSENLVPQINREDFNGLMKLETLNISGMIELRVIEENAFANLNSLEIFICRGNKMLSSLYLGDLLKMENLKTFDISHNNLIALDFGKNEDVDKALNSSKIEGEQKYFQHLHTLRLEGNPWHCDCKIMKALEFFNKNSSYFKRAINSDNARCETPFDLLSKLLYDLQSQSIYDLSSHFYCSDQKPKPMKIPVYDPPQFLRPKSVMLTVFAVVAVVVIGIIIGFIIVCIKRRLKSNEFSSYSNPIRYTAVRDSTISNNATYQQQ